MLDISPPHLAQISCRNSAGMISYVSENFGENALGKLFEGILSNDTLISKTYQYLGTPLALDYFENENNWYSNQINLMIFDNLSRMGIDAYNTGRHAVVAAKKTRNVATIAYLQMLGPLRIINKVNKVNAIYNRTKTVELINAEEHSALLQLNYNVEHNEQVTRQNIGVYVGILQSTGLRNVICEVEADDFNKLNYTVLKFSWQPTPRLQQLNWLIGKKIAMLFCKTYLRTDDVILSFHENLVGSFETAIAEKEIQRKKSDTYYNQLIEQQEHKEQNLKRLVEEKTAQLAQSIEDKEILFENFSHELKTPLTLIIGPIEQLLKQQLTPSVIQQLKGVNNNAHRLFELVKTLLDFAELKVNRNKLVATNIYSCTTYIISSIQSLADTKNVKISLNYLCDKNLTLKLRAQSWELILSNLLINAIKHGYDNNYISITFEQSQQKLKVTVTDNNLPISKGKQQEITSRFTASNSNEHGQGLGLAIINELVTRHNGTLEFGENNSGNQLSIYLPLTLNASTKLISPEALIQQSSNTELVLPNKKSKESPNILLVEDNIELADFLISSFKPHFYVFHCVNGRDALTKLDDQLFDLIISDVMMPIMDGYEFCRQVKSSDIFKHIPLILLTAKTNIESQKKGLSLQADDYIGKPFNTDILIQKITNITATYKAYAITLKQQLTSTSYKPLTQPTTTGTKEDKQKIFLKKVRECLLVHYKNVDLKAGDIANFLHMSEKTLNRKLQVLVSNSITDILSEYRLNQAKQLLNQGAQLKEIYFDCGFNSMSYFSRCFKQHFGMTPSEYQSKSKIIPTDLSVENEIKH